MLALPPSFPMNTKISVSSRVRNTANTAMFTCVLQNSM